MALSASTNYSRNRTQIINAALRILNVYTEAYTPSSFEMESAAETLNLMIKSWQTDGLQLWTRRTKSVTLVSGTQSYTLGPSGTVVMDRPLRILSATIKQTSTGDEYELTQISRKEYHTLSDKTSSGTPTSFLYDPQLTNGVLYLWPVINTSGYTAELLYLKPYDDLDEATNDLEFPQEWLEPIKYGLAARLCDEYSKPLPERGFLWNKAERMKAEVNSADVESAPTYFYPDMNA